MTAAVLTFDRLAYIDRLKEAGFDDKQARAHASALDSALRETVATKADVGEVRHEVAEVRREVEEAKTELRRDIREAETRLEAKIETSAANLKVEILRWLIVTQLALAGFIFAAVKFVK